MTPRVCASAILQWFKVLDGEQAASHMANFSFTSTNGLHDQLSKYHTWVRTCAQWHSGINMKGTAGQMSKYHKHVHRNTHVGIHTHTGPAVPDEEISAVEKKILLRGRRPPGYRSGELREGEGPCGPTERLQESICGHKWRDEGTAWTNQTSTRCKRSDHRYW